MICDMPFGFVELRAQMDIGGEIGKADPVSHSGKRRQ